MSVFSLEQCFVLCKQSQHNEMVNIRVLATNITHSALYTTLK